MSEYIVTIEGESPLIMHDVIGGMDNASPANKEKSAITKRKGPNRTESDDARLRELEALTALWFTVRGQFGIPERAIRSMIETAAKTQRQGPQVRQGLRVLKSDFDYDKVKYGTTPEELSSTTQFTVPVRVQQSTINRTRAKIDPPWTCRFVIDADDELVGEQELRSWLVIGGRRIGLGDWRPAKSGSYGMFNVTEIEVTK